MWNILNKWLPMRKKSRLLKALEKGVRPGGDLVEELDELQDDHPVRTQAEAEAICAALDHVAAHSKDDRHMTSSLFRVAALFQQVDSEEAGDFLKREGLPRLLKNFDAQWAAADRDMNDLLFVLKIFAMCGYEDGISRIVAAARDPLGHEGYLWSVIFGQFAEDHPFREFICDELRDPLPTGFCGVAYLDFVNALAREEEIKDHPFDTTAGKAILHGWLIDTSPEHFSYAHSATAALPFIGNPERDQLIALAMDHLDTGVQMEAAWASARLGSESGIKFLARLCLDPRTCKTACTYLQELGREDAVPQKAQDPDHQALAEMCSWLEHPQELGRPPDEIELYDSREIYWPPTDDRRRLWLLKYRYFPRADGDEENSGVGMVGSVTFALFGEATADLPAEDVYALHCCWELEMNEDPRAPKKRSANAGKKILARYQ